MSFDQSSPDYRIHSVAGNHQHRLCRSQLGAGTIGTVQAPWLSMDANPGSLGPSEAALVNVTCDSSQLSPGTYTATLKVSDTDSGTPVQPQYITVTLTVSS